MTEYVLSIDPGISTGVALIGYTPDSYPTLEGAWQFAGGVGGLKAWLAKHYRPAWCDPETYDEYPPSFKPSELSFRVGLRLEDEVSWDYDEDTEERKEWVVGGKQVTVICEKFNARNTRGFSYTTASLEPLRGEGALIALDLMPDYTPKEKRWRDPGLQYLVGGKDLADKKKRQHRFLKDNGFYRTGKDFGTPDADDFRSAAAQGLAYSARELKHPPTFELLSSWEG